MIGFRTGSGTDVNDSTELIANVSAFADLSARTSVGVETNYASGQKDTEEYLLVMPQLHVELFQRLLLQAGAGPFFTESDTFAEAAFRVAFTF